MVGINLMLLFLINDCGEQKGAAVLRQMKRRMDVIRHRLFEPQARTILGERKKNENASMLWISTATFQAKIMVKPQHQGLLLQAPRPDGS